MCVIFIADRKRPTEEMVEKAWEKNKEGGGVAWREKEYVRWHKGLTLAEMHDYIAKLPMPFVAHFRIQTVGGQRPELTHPFAVDPTSPLHLKGRTKGFMLFHNGTWHTWKKDLMETVVNSGTKMPGGRWSDSRAMGFVASVYGTGILDLIDEKSVVLSPDDVQVYGSGWSRINDVACSNRLWEDIKITNKIYSAEEVNGNKKVDVKDEKAGGLSPAATFRTSDETLQREKDQSKIVEETSSGIRTSHEEKVNPVSLQSFDDALAMTEFVRSLNPSTFRRPLTPDTTERDRRIEAARNGITHIGKMY